MVNDSKTRYKEECTEGNENLCVKGRKVNRSINLLLRYVNWKMCIIRERGVRIPFQSIHS